MLTEGNHRRITPEAVAVVVRQFDDKFICMLLDRDYDFKITQAVVEAVARKSRIGSERVMESILASGRTIKVTPEATRAIQQQFNRRVINTLMARHPYVEYIEEVRTVVTGSITVGNPVMQGLLDRFASYSIADGSNAGIK